MCSIVFSSFYIEIAYSNFTFCCVNFFGKTSKTSLVCVSRVFGKQHQMLIFNISDISVALSVNLGKLSSVYKVIPFVKLVNINHSS